MKLLKNVTLKAIVGKQVQLELEDGQTLLVDKENFGYTLEQGALFSIEILSEEEAQLKQQEIAIHMLNHILENGSHRGTASQENQKST